MHGLRVLVTNIRLKERAGTEMVVRDLAAALQRAGHQVAVYSPQLGAVADEIRQQGVAVSDRLSAVELQPEIVHGQHTGPALEALLQFPQAAGIYVCHDSTAPVDIPPLFPRLYLHVAVDLNCAQRVLRSGVDAQALHVVANAVDMERFRLRASLPSRPRRAAIFSNYIGAGPLLESVRQACLRHGITLDAYGLGMHNPAAAPEQVLPHYDLVFGKARCALEAMAVGCATIVMDKAGMAGVVTRDRVAAMRQWNFGARLLTRAATAEAIADEIAKYDAADAEQVGSFIRAEAGLERAVQQYCALYRQALAAHAAAAPATRRREQRVAARWTRRTEPRRKLREVLREVPLLGPALVGVKRLLFPLPASPPQPQS